MMVRIAGITLPNKKIDVALSYIYGIGQPLALQLLAKANIDKEKRTNDLTEDEVNKIRELISNFKVEGDLRREVLLNIRRLKEVGCYRGTRHMKHLPVRGQKTKTNSRSVRGNVRKTAMSGKRTLTKT